jgi:prepilin-type N-terminal cleavage/methylation domain-containing protein
MGKKGVTLPELSMAMLLLGVVVVTVGPYLTRVLQSGVKASLEADSMDNTQVASMKVERDFEEMTLISSATPVSIEFQLDSHRLPGYDPNALDPKGVPFRLSPDWDGDEVGVGGMPVVATDFNGYNTWDQDDDNDGKIDVQCRYFLDANDNLIRDFNYNETGWDLHREMMLPRVQKPLFGYVGSINHIPGKDADLNKDGLVTAQEIDANPNGGNNNLLLDTALERLYIDAIDVDLRQDRNNDGVADFRLTYRVRPPLLTTNRRV